MSGRRSGDGTGVVPGGHRDRHRRLRAVPAASGAAAATPPPARGAAAVAFRLPLYFVFPLFGIEGRAAAGLRGRPGAAGGGAGPGAANGAAGGRPLLGWPRPPARGRVGAGARPRGGDAAPHLLRAPLLGAAGLGLALPQGFGLDLGWVGFARGGCGGAKAGPDPAPGAGLRLLGRRRSAAGDVRAELGSGGRGEVSERNGGFKIKNNNK